ncbi:tropomyosin-like isoform X2 [Ahaetulla prasina]|uniref:tropomyosin-like isoform X2 n=1 Tax=Ahaetulla prasina TaxID=499056 RepID=UPI002647137A|nr:tropomyosin-like isoform X2 [Ahaetulla prasina]
MSLRLSTDMGGLLTCRQCSKRMESLKDHSFWDLCRTWVRYYFWFILVTVIVFTLSIIPFLRAPPEQVRKCPKDQAKLLHNISQLEAEKLTLKEQLRATSIKMEKKMQKLRNLMNQTQEKTLQLLEKKQGEVDALSKELSVCNQSLVLTRQLLGKEKEKAQSLQNQLEKEKEDLRKIQQQRDSWQKQLNTLEEKLKSPGSKIKEYEDKIAALQRQIEQEHVNVRHERDEYENRIMNLQYQIGSQQQKKHPIENILEDGAIVSWACVILFLFICYVKCCRSLASWT